MADSTKGVKVNGNGIGFLSLLGIVFITLKLCNVITWSWWWVTAPLWGGLALAGGVLVVGILLVCITAVLKTMKK